MKTIAIVVALAAAGLFLLRWSWDAAWGSACWGQGVGGGGGPFPSPSDTSGPLTPSQSGGGIQA